MSTLMQLNGRKQILAGTIGNNHIDQTDKIQEANLLIDWASHTEILKNRKIVTTNQLSDVTVGGLGQIDVTAMVGGANIPSALSGNTIEGVLVDAPLNHVLIRQLDGKEILAAGKYEVYGRMTVTTSGGATPVNTYTVKFYYLTDDQTTPVETAYVMDGGQEPVAMIYAQRYNLLTAPETFASNQRMIQSQTDEAIQSVLQAHDSEIRSAHTNAKATPVTFASLKERLDAMDADIVTASNTSGASLDNLKADLSSTGVGKGASLVGIRAAASLNGADVTVEQTLEGIVTEIKDARGSMASTGARLDVALNEDGTLKEGTKIHRHRRKNVNATDSQTDFDLYAMFGEYFQADDTLQVFVGGMLQNESDNYTVIMKAGSSTLGQTVRFLEGLSSTDKVAFCYNINNLA